MEIKSLQGHKDRQALISIDDISPGDGRTALSLAHRPRSHLQQNLWLYAGIGGSALGLGVLIAFFKSSGE